MSHRSVTIRGERVRLYRRRDGSWYTHQGDLTCSFEPDPDGKGFDLMTQPRNRVTAWTHRGNGRTMQQAVDNSNLPETT